jgi:hypothetical protein
MDNLDHISQSLETIYWSLIFKFFDADPGSGIIFLLDDIFSESASYAHGKV